jgi:hypothetical protein
VLTSTMEVKYFKVKHKFFKNSLHGQIWLDLDKISLKMSGKARQIPIIPRKNQKTRKSIFSCIKKNLSTKAVGSFKN